MIELIIVIVIVGVLSAVALPKFINMGAEARISSVNALAGAIQSTANDVRMLCAASAAAGCDLTNPQQHVYLHGQWYWLEYGWLDAGDDINTDEIDVALNYSGFSISLPNAYSTLFSVPGAPNPATCSVLYYQATTAAPNPVITVNTSGC